MLPEANNQHSVVNAISAAEELPRVRNTAFVELHCVCIQANGNWTVFEEPLSHLGFVLRDFHPSSDSHCHLASVVLASLILAIIPIF